MRLWRMMKYIPLDFLRAVEMEQDNITTKALKVCMILCTNIVL